MSEAPLAPEWITQNAESLGDLAGNDVLSRYGSIPDLAKGLLDTKAMVGNRIPIPGDDASAEQRGEFYDKLSKVPGVVRVPTDSEDADGWQALYKKMGAPETPDGYEIKPDGMPEGVSIDEDLLAAIKPAAHARGVSNKQLNGLFGAMADVMGKRAEAAQTATAASAEALKAEWGVAYDEKKAAAIGVAERIGGDEFRAFLEAHGEAAIHPGLMKTFSAIAEKFGEDTGVDDNLPYRGAMTPDDAAMALAEIRSNKDHPFNDPRAPREAKGIARARIYELQCLSNGQKPDPEQVAFVKGR